MNSPYSFHSESINRSIHMWLYTNSEFDYFGEVESNSFFCYDLPILETEAYRNYQNNL